MRRIGKVLVALSLLTIGSTPGLMKSCGGGGGGMGHYQAATDGIGSAGKVLAMAPVHVRLR